eukprot:3731797-Prymnesium_polylepis.1
MRDAGAWIGRVGARDDSAQRRALRPLGPLCSPKVVFLSAFSTIFTITRRPDCGTARASTRCPA